MRVLGEPWTCAMCVACANNVYLLCNKAIICRRISNLVYCNIIFHLMQTFSLLSFLAPGFCSLSSAVSIVRENRSSSRRATQRQYYVLVFHWDCLTANDIIDGSRRLHVVIAPQAQHTDRIEVVVDGSAHAMYGFVPSTYFSYMQLKSVLASTLTPEAILWINTIYREEKTE